jgi:hypothetical protein
MAGKGQEAGTKQMRTRISAYLLIPVLLVVLFVSYKIVRWKAYVWLPDYVAQVFRGRDVATETPIHVIFVLVDYYEPGLGERGAERNRAWLEKYKALADRHKDSYGRKPQHTWFYAYDHKNAAVMKDLSEAVREGYGEVEFHWHHGNDTNESFRAQLREALEWFNSFGAMLSCAPDSAVRFAFIHGDCALDNSGPPELCGVSRELDLLREAGCYADFTFPSLGSPGQPSKVNSIYYAKDDDNRKSYDTGEDAAVGKKVPGRLLMFQGPMTLVPTIELFEYGAIETDQQPSPERVDRWIAARIAVKGRPEWIFVETHTHGLQSEDVMLSTATDRMLSHLEARYGTGDFRLHYVTAREAYNIVRAAEDSLSGDPDSFRDYEIRPPRNRQAPL